MAIIQPFEHAACQTRLDGYGKLGRVGVFAGAGRMTLGRFSGGTLPEVETVSGDSALHRNGQMNGIRQRRAIRREAASLQGQRDLGGEGRDLHKPGVDALPARL